MGMALPHLENLPQGAGIILVVEGTDLLRNAEALARVSEDPDVVHREQDDAEANRSCQK